MQRGIRQLGVPQVLKTVSSVYNKLYDKSTLSRPDKFQNMINVKTFNNFESDSAY